MKERGRKEMQDDVQSRNPDKGKKLAQKVDSVSVSADKTISESSNPTTNTY